MLHGVAALMRRDRRRCHAAACIYALAEGYDLCLWAPIIAVADGTVTRASWNGGYGECVIVYHGGGISSLYAHCDNTSSTRKVYEVKVGDVVKRGQVLAYVGTTGSSTGNHLHFGIIDTNTYSSVSGNYVNPGLYLPKNVYS